MAVGDSSQLPSLPPGFEGLARYLRDRDTGPPTNDVHPSAIEQVHLSGGMREDRLDWDYSDPAVTEGVGADGFILWVAYDLTTTDPQRGGFVLSGAQRKTSLLAPNVACSYAIAPFRYTHRGIELGAKVAPAIWRVEPLEGVTVGQARGTYLLQGARDGFNQEFTAPFTVQLDPEGLPVAQVIFKRAHLIWTTNDSPARGEWTMRDPGGAQIIVVGEPPKGTPNEDYLAIVGACSAS